MGTICGDAHFENDILVLLVCFCGDLLGEPDDGLEVDVGLLFLCDKRRQIITQAGYQEEIPLGRVQSLVQTFVVLAMVKDGR